MKINFENDRSFLADSCLLRPAIKMCYTASRTVSAIKIDEAQGGAAAQLMLQRADDVTNLLILYARRRVYYSLSF